MRAVDGLYRVCGALAALCLAAICSLILAQIAGRFFAFRVLSANELSGYLVLASTFLALGPTLRYGTHIRVVLVVQRLPAAVRRLVEATALLLAIALACYATWWSIDLVMDSIEYGEVSPGRLSIPLAIPQAAMVLGLGVFVVALCHCLVELVRGQQPAYAQGRGMMED